MSKSSDPGHFFQTETALATAARRAAKSTNTAGDPITVTSKILDILPDPLNHSRVYIAESGGFVRRIDLETGDKSHIFKGHTVPTTAIAIDPTGKRLYGASWDKTVICWDTETRQPLLTFKGHTDFIKGLLYIPCPKSSPYPGGILLSGSSDKSIIVWDAATGKELNILKGHTRAIGTFAVDPMESTADVFVVYAGGSEREIRKWTIPLADIGSAKEADEPILEHDTSVIKIRFQGDDYDCWTASADFTARRIDVRDVAKKSGQMTDTLLKHADYVNDVVVEPRGRYVITACRDEDVKLWDIGTGTLYHTFVGHADEVTGLAIVGESGQTLVSVSIDCTVRKWSLAPADLKVARELAISGQPKEEKNTLSALTEEEERELAELMDDSD